MIFKIVNYTRTNSLERNGFIDNICKYYSKNDKFKTTAYLDMKDDLIYELRYLELNSKKELNRLKEIVKELEDE